MEPCRYCLETKKELGNVTLIYPCRCTTPICLVCSRKRSDIFANQSPKYATVCEICLSKYDHEIVSNVKKSTNGCTRHQYPYAIQVIVLIAMIFGTAFALLSTLVSIVVVVSRYC